MTKDKFEKAKIIQEQIEHVSGIIDAFGDRTYMLTPPTRYTTCCLIGPDSCRIGMTESEVVCIRKAFEDMLTKLNREFDNL